MAAGHFRDQIGGRRRDDHQVGVARQPDMADVEFALRIEQIGEGPMPRERADGQRRNEFMSGFCQNAAHNGTALAQSPDQVERFIGGDAAANHEQNALAGHDVVPDTFVRTYRRSPPKQGGPSAVWLTAAAIT